MKTNCDVRLSLSEAKKRPPNPRPPMFVHHNEPIRETHKPGWTPAPDLASLRRMEPVKKPTRDYEALTKAALRKPVGYWEDAPRGLQFVKGAKVEIHPGGCECAACAPIPDGARGDVWRWHYFNRVNKMLYVFNDADAGRYLSQCGNNIPTSGRESYGSDLEEITQAQFIAKLREWKHPALDEFEAQPRKQVEGRVFGQPNYPVKWVWDSAKGCGYARLFDGKWIEHCEPLANYVKNCTELHGPEADAIIRECAKAMGLCPQKPE